MRHPLELIFIRGIVEETEPVTSQMRRIRIASPQIRDIRWTPGQHVRLNVTPLETWILNPRDARRTYSIWQLNHDRGSLDLCILDHEGDGPGTRWSRSVHVDQPVTLSHPEGRLTLRHEAPYHLFAGDETASTAFHAMLAALPDSASAYGVLETSDHDGEVPLPANHPLPWVHRNTSTEPTPLLSAIRELPLPAQSGTAYLAGNADDCQSIRRHLLHDRGWPRHRIITKPFWAAGKRGLE